MKEKIVRFKAKNCNWEEEAMGGLCFFVSANVKPMTKTQGEGD